MTAVRSRTVGASRYVGNGVNGFDRCEEFDGKSEGICLNSLSSVLPSTCESP